MTNPPDVLNACTAPPITNHDPATTTVMVTELTGLYEVAKYRAIVRLVQKFEEEEKRDG